MIRHEYHERIDTRTGEIINLSRLSYPPKPNRHNRPAYRYRRRRESRPLEDLVVVFAGFFIAGAFLFGANLG
jgi:hypothetical protein